MRGILFRTALSLAFLLVPLDLLAQTTETHPAEAQEAAKPDEPRLFYPDAEFVASTQFRDATLILPVWRKLNFEGHYYGNDEADVGLTALSWQFTLWNKLTLAPGFGAGFGFDYGTAPIATLRWEAEHSWFHAEGFESISLRPAVPPAGDLQDSNDFTRYAYISDGSHISARWNRLEGGVSWEHIAVREEHEWKTGGRFAVALTRHLDFVAFILAPDTEFRCGLRFHPPEEKR